MFRNVLFFGGWVVCAQAVDPTAPEENIWLDSFMMKDEESTTNRHEVTLARVAPSKVHPWRLLFG